MWKLPDDTSPDVLTARAKIDSTHAPDAPSTLSDTALLFFMSGTAIRHSTHSCSRSVTVPFPWAPCPRSFLIKFSCFPPCREVESGV